MKRWKKVVLIVLAVLVVIIGALALWQWKNLKALHAALTLDQETLAQSVQEKTQTHQQELENSGVTVAPPSLQQSEDLLDGKVTADEVKDALGIATPPQSDQAAVQSSESIPSAEELLNQCVAELYACQIDLLAQLGEMKQAALDQWNALPAQTRTSQQKQEIGMAGLQECYALEVETDAIVKGILADYRARFGQIGADTGVLDQLWVYYCEEKEAQKAFYLNKYLK